MKLTKLIFKKECDKDAVYRHPSFNLYIETVIEEINDKNSVFKVREETIKTIGFADGTVLPCSEEIRKKVEKTLSVLDSKLRNNFEMSMNNRNQQMETEFNRYKSMR